MLSKIEYGIRALYWAQVNAMAKVKSPFPKPIDPPSKQLQMKRKLDSLDTEEIDRALGIKR